MSAGGKGSRSLVTTSALAALAAFVVTVLSVIGAGTVVAEADRSYHLQSLYESTDRTFRAALDPRYQTKAEEIGRVATRLAVLDVVRGGAVLDTSGHRLQTFGEPATTSFEDLKRDAGRIRETGDAGRVEFYFSPDDTATPFHILARMDTAPITALRTLAVERAILVALIGGVAAAIGTLLIVEMRIAAPLRQVLRVVEQVVKDPALADTGERLPEGRTEIGRLSAELERFRGFIAEVWRKKVLVAESLLEQSPFAIVQMVADGTPTFANGPAATLFDRDLVRSQSAAPLVVRDMESGVRAVLREHVDRFGAECRLIEIITSEGARYAVGGGLLVGKQTRVPTYVAMFADATAVQRARLSAEYEQREQVRLTRQAERRLFELKLSLESCLTLMGGGDPVTGNTMEVLPFAEEWFSAARTAGLVTAYNVGKESPLLAGGPDDLKAVIRLSLLVAYTHVGATPVMMTFDLKGINFETAGLTIKAQRAGQDGEDDAVAADRHLALAALRQAIRRVGGQIGDVTAAEDSVQVRLILKGAAERLQTAMKAGASR